MGISPSPYTVDEIRISRLRTDINHTRLSFVIPAFLIKFSCYFHAKIAYICVINTIFYLNIPIL